MLKVTLESHDSNFAIPNRTIPDSESPVQGHYDLVRPITVGAPICNTALGATFRSKSCLFRDLTHQRNRAQCSRGEVRATKPSQKQLGDNYYFDFGGLRCKCVITSNIDL